MEIFKGYFRNNSVELKIQLFLHVLMYFVYIFLFDTLCPDVLEN